MGGGMVGWGWVGFELYFWVGGAWGAGTNMWHSEIACYPTGQNIFSHFGYIYFGGRGVGSDNRSMSCIRSICKCPLLVKGGIGGL